MLTSSICDGAATLSGNNSFNKRLKALEQAIASYSTVVASEKISGNDGEFKNIEVSNTATINKENVEQSNIDDLNVSHIDNREGFAALGQVTVKSLQIEGDEGITSTFKTLTATNANVSELEATKAHISEATVDTLNVTNKIDDLNLKVVRIDDKKALSSSQMLLKIAEGFNTANFSTAIRPMWQNKTIALVEDTTGVFTLQGIVNDVSMLPENPANGDCYFVRSYTDGTLTGPAVAAYVNGEWGYILYPGLDDYITNTDFATWEETNYVPFVTEVRSYLNTLITDASDFEENPANYDIKALYEAIKAIDDSLNGEEGEYYLFKERTLNFIENEFEVYKQEVTDVLETKISDPTEDGEYLRRVSTSEGVTSAEWLKLEDNDKFVNKNYSETVDEEIKSSAITNDTNGITLDSNIGVYASTADNTNEDKSLAVINQDYLRTNLSLSKESGGTARSSYFFEEKGIMPQSEHIYLTSAYSNGDSTTWYYNKYLPNLYHIQTKNYEYTRFFNYTANEANSYTFFFSCDKSGNISKMNQVEDGSMNLEAQASAHSKWMAFSPDAYDGIVDDYAYYAFPRAQGANTTAAPAGSLGYINIYDKGKWVGRVKDAEGNEFGIYNWTTNDSPQYYHIGGKSLRGNSKRMLVVNSSPTAASNIKALVIGVDANGEEGLDRCKPISLPSLITRGTEGLAAGKNYWWFQNGTSNVFSRVDKDGNIASYTLVDPVDSVALSASACRNAFNNYIELENGDCLFYISDVASGRYDYFIYCSDDPSEASPVEVYRSAVMFASTAETDRWPCAANFPFVELGNYIYFFMSFNSNITDGGSVMGSGNSAHWKASAAQYARFDKTAKTWAYQTLPWTIDNYPVYGPAQKLLTEDDYLWVFPNQAYGSTTSGSTCLVISPSGQATNVDLGTGSSINWFYAGGTGGYMNGWSCYLNQSGTASWNYARSPNCLAAVNSHGLGCLVSEDFRHLLLFKGNGEYKIYDYSSGEKGFFPEGMQAYRGGPSLIPMKDGFLIGFNHSTTYRLATNPEGESSGVIYISAIDDINEEPTYKMFETNEGNGLFHKYMDPYGYNLSYENYNKRFRTMCETHMHSCPVEQAVGISVWKENVGSSEGTIYLKDGDYEISEVAL